MFDKDWIKNYGLVSRSKNSAEARDWKIFASLISQDKPMVGFLFQHKSIFRIRCGCLWRLTDSMFPFTDTVKIAVI